jgi:hypothetical protein
MVKAKRSVPELLFAGAGLITVAFMAYSTGGNYIFAVGFLIIPAIVLVIFFPLPIFLVFVASFPFNVFRFL